MGLTVMLSGSRLMEVRSGLLELQSRVLPAISDLRVAVIFTSLRPVLERYLEAVHKQKAEIDRAEAMPEGSAERREIELRIGRDLEAIAAELYEVPAPRRRLTVDDLPVAVRSRDGAGAMNAAGRAQIMTALAPEFFDLADPDAAPAEGTD